MALLGWVVMLAASGQGEHWAQAKVVLFALLVSCGIAIRINLKPFVPAFLQMMDGSGGDAANATMARCITRCRPWVWLIWAGLFTSAALGIHLLG